MFDQRKHYESQNRRNNVRGKLKKQLYHCQQSEIEMKRKQMKAILDKQVQENKKIRQKQRQRELKRMQEEQHRIRVYNNKSSQKEKNIINSSVSLKSNSEQNKGKEKEKEFLIRKQSGSRKKLMDLADMPVMPLLDMSETTTQQSITQQTIASPPMPQKKNFRKSAGHLPLLSPLDSSLIKQTKTEEVKCNLIVEENHDKVQVNEIFEEINQQIEEQNHCLKNQLKKNQQALEVLIGAMKSNSNLERFRIHAERILKGNQNQKESRKPNSSQKKEKQEQKQKESFNNHTNLPNLQVRNISFMHDYIFESAKRRGTKNK